ncbi:MAG: type I-B CRISPR-associated protein Cas5b [Halanaeroarchaeum sp.]
MPQATLEASVDEAGYSPERVLSLTVSGPWGHFRRIEGNVVKQTYRIVPRTTVAGMLAAVLGIGRDEYYDLFAPERSAIAIEPVAELRTVNLPMNTLSTAEGDLTSLNGRGKLSIKLPNPEKPRQQHNYEVLVDPAYRIDVALDHDGHFDALREMLSAGKSHYVPSLGLSEYLAEIDYHGVFTIDGPDTSDDPVRVDSAVPGGFADVIVEPDARVQIEESPAFMTTDGGGRTRTGSTTYAFNPDAGPLTVQGANVAHVDGRSVVFV